MDLDKLAEEYPTCQFICMQVYSYSGCPYEELLDGSIFVADPSSPGDGPGGQRILSAARLTGSGTQNISGFLYMDYFERTHLFNCDATLNVQNRSTASGVGITGSICKVIFDDHVTAVPKTLRGIDTALLTAAVCCKRIVLCSSEEEGDKTAKEPKVIVVERGDLNEFAFFQKAQQIALTSVPTHSHKLPPAELLPADLAGAPVLLISGDLPDTNALVQSLPSAVLNSADRKLTVFNLGVDYTKEQAEREVPAVEGTIRYVCGPGALKILTGLAQE